VHNYVWDSTLKSKRYFSQTAKVTSTLHVIRGIAARWRVTVQVADWVRSWPAHNPSFQRWFWTDSAARTLLLLDASSSSRLFPASLARLYDSYPLPINRADVRKYLALYAAGGLVADLDVECLRPLAPLLARLRHCAGCVLSQEPPLHRLALHAAAPPVYLSTALMACAPRHPFIAHLLRLLPRFADNSRRLYVHRAPDTWTVPFSGVTMGWLLRLVTAGGGHWWPPTVLEFLVINFRGPDLRK